MSDAAKDGDGESGKDGSTTVNEAAKMAEAEAEKSPGDNEPVSPRCDGEKVVAAKRQREDEGHGPVGPHRYIVERGRAPPSVN